jgi:hypothetical protein
MCYNPNGIGLLRFFERKLWPVLALLTASLIPGHSMAVGSWVPLNNSAPDFINGTLLLPDGTVMAANGGSNWYRLTPDSNGSYVNGTWSTLASMHYQRLYYSSQVLTNGQVIVVGAEYSPNLFSGPGTTNGELYNPQSNTWTLLPNTPTLNKFYDSCSEILPNGNVIISPVTPATFGGTLIWNTASNLWMTGPNLYRGDDQDEATWVKLPDNSVLTIDPYGTNSERYIPSLNKWINDSNVPVVMYDPVKSEIGAGLLLPNGQAFFTGGTGNTVFYTPSGTTNAGAWTAGPVLPNSLVTGDAPAAMMVNGKALFVMSDGVYSNTSSFYEYDPVANAFTQTTSPGGGSTISEVTYSFRMLDLPDGTILLSDGGTELYVYQPDGSPLPAGQPAINTFTVNSNGTYQLTGTLFNGLNEGASYGDDAQMNSNYPLVRMTNSLGKVFYARTFNWNSTGVMTGTNIVTTQFAVPTNVPYGIYSLVVTANGNASAPVNLYYSPDTLLLTFANNALFTGTYGGPFTPSSYSFTLTNIGATSINWSAGTTSSWFQISSTSGTLSPGGATATVTVSLNASASSLPFGTYSSTVWFTNTSDNFVWSEPVTLVAYPPQLMQNGGFETYSSSPDVFPNWTLSGTEDGYEFEYNDSAYAHSGNDCAVFQPQSGFSYLSQTIPTTPGQAYLVSFWMLNYYSVIPSQFLVSWAGTNLVNLINIAPNYAWTQMQYLVTAKTASSLLQFGIEYEGSGGEFFGLDDVSVTAIQVPSFRSPTKSNNSIQLTWNAMYGQEYQLQYATNLFNPVWNNLGNSITAANATITVTDSAPTNSQRFYHLLLLP